MIGLGVPPVCPGGRRIGEVGIKRAGRALLRALAGVVGGAVLASAVGFGAGRMVNISQAEGACAMGIAVCWMPAAGLPGALLGAVWGATRRG